jgi:hypothetical protein
MSDFADLEPGDLYLLTEDDLRALHSLLGIVNANVSLGSAEGDEGIRTPMDRLERAAGIALLVPDKP